MVHEVFLGLGTNLGDREQNLLESIRLIGERVGKVTRQSSFVETAPWGFQSEHPFLNAVVCCETTKPPHQVLRLTQQIERELGKTKEHATRRSPHSTLNIPHSTLYKDRPIDIDILLYDDVTIDEPDLKIPHPLMFQRDFVMIPLRQITNKY